MGRPIARVVVGKEHSQSFSRYEAQRGDLVLGRGAYQIPRQVEAGQTNRVRVRVEQLNERRRVGPGSQPLIDLQLVWVAQLRGQVGGAEGWLAERPASVVQSANGEIGNLKPKNHGVKQLTARGEQENTFALFAEGETQVVTWRGRLAIGIEHQVLPGSKASARGEDILLRIIQCIRDAHAGKINRYPSSVVELDQVRELAGDRHSSDVPGQNFVDLQIGPSSVHSPGFRDCRRSRALPDS